MQTLSIGVYIILERRTTSNFQTAWLVMTTEHYYHLKKNNKPTRKFWQFYKLSICFVCSVPHSNFEHVSASEVNIFFPSKMMTSFQVKKKKRQLQPFIWFTCLKWENSEANYYVLRAVLRVNLQAPCAFYSQIIILEILNAIVNDSTSESIR